MRTPAVASTTSGRRPLATTAAFLAACWIALAALALTPSPARAASAAADAANVAEDAMASTAAASDATGANAAGTSVALVSRDGTTASYDSLEDAVAAIPAGGTATLTLAADATFVNTLTFAEGSVVTFDLNGHGITQEVGADGKYAELSMLVLGTLTLESSAEGGQLTLGNEFDVGTEDGTKAGSLIQRNVTITSTVADASAYVSPDGYDGATGITALVIGPKGSYVMDDAAALLQGGSAEAALDSFYALAVLSGGTATLSSGTIRAHANSESVGVYLVAGSTCTVDGASISSNLSASGQASADDEAGMTGTFLSGTASGVYSLGQLTVADGVIEGGVGDTAGYSCGIKAHDGTMGITGGTIRGRWHALALTGFSQATEGDASLNIEGGSFESTKEGEESYGMPAAVSFSDIEAHAQRVTISGGSFTGADCALNIGLGNNAESSCLVTGGEFYGGGSSQVRYDSDAARAATTISGGNFHATSTLLDAYGPALAFAAVVVIGLLVLAVAKRARRAHE